MNQSGPTPATVIPAAQLLHHVQGHDHSRGAHGPSVDDEVRPEVPRAA
jgi:hypothetical protein